jgi:serine/threonine-protein kinase
MVTGRPPFLGDSPVTVASKQVLEQPGPPSQLNPDVTPELDAVILRSLAKNPANRYQSAEEMRADLDRVKHGLPVETTPLLAAGATQALDRPPPPTTQVLPPHEPERKGGAWIPIAVTLVLIGLLGLLLWFLATTFLSDDNTQTGVQVAVPDVVGESRADAERILEAADLVPVIERRVQAQNDAQQPGTVVAQNPEADTEVDRGSIVNLTIVAQPNTVVIPNLQGATVEEAQAALLDLGLEPAGPQEESSDTVDEGRVTRTDPGVGEEVEEGTPVTIFVSTGSDEVTVPEVTCQSFGSAQRELTDAGLIAVAAGETAPPNPLCPNNPNKVAAQDPAAGTVVEPGQQVTLFPPEEAPPPTGPTGDTGVD